LARSGYAGAGFFFLHPHNIVSLSTVTRKACAKIRGRWDDSTSLTAGVFAPQDMNATRGSTVGSALPVWTKRDADRFSGQ
jgi:hypothetical protein